LGWKKSRDIVRVRGKEQLKQEKIVLKDQMVLFFLPLVEMECRSPWRMKKVEFFCPLHPSL